MIIRHWIVFWHTVWVGMRCASHIFRLDVVCSVYSYVTSPKMIQRLRPNRYAYHFWYLQAIQIYGILQQSKEINIGRDCFAIHRVLIYFDFWRHWLSSKKFCAVSISVLIVSKSDSFTLCTCLWLFRLGSTACLQCNIQWRPFMKTAFTI